MRSTDVLVRLRATLGIAFAIGLASCAAEPTFSDEASVAYTELPERVFWGDLHVHSNLSFDSNSFGNEALGPEAAYRFAMGEEITASSGRKAKLARPLDFLLVADHAEYLGVLESIRSGDESVLDSVLGRRWAGFLNGEGTGRITQDYVAMVSRQAPIERPSEKYERTVWARSVALADEFNDPGKFTAFAGYEWTAMPGGRNLHRVVLFRDGSEKAGQTLPFSALDSEDPEDLWDYFAGYEEKTGGQVLGIAHNGNLSAGIMFDDVRLDGSPLNARYAKMRRRWEPVYEVTQVKGDGEAHPLLSPNDRFADFENWDETDISLRPRSADPDEARRTLEGEYARSGLKKGLGFEAELGANPYEFGLMGSTDSHTAMATADDDNFWGKFRDSEIVPDRLSSKMGGALWANIELVSSGYTGVWARANTREEIFDAFKRREVYATSGPRIRLRVFGGWDFSDADIEAEGFAEAGYARGVPMGGVLEAKGEGAAPGFLIAAQKDPDDVNLEFIQVVKGWRGSDGQLKEQVFDLVPENAEGQVEFKLFWQDPQFDPAEAAFYYVRAIQQPTKRWSTWDAERSGVELPEGVKRMIRERAYSSPIWYYPPD